MAATSPGQTLPAIPALEAILGQYLASCSAPQPAAGQDSAAASRSLLVQDATAPTEEKTVAAGRHRGQVTGKMLREHFHLPLHTVAKKFGMCTTAFKKLCRRFEIPKWPHRQVSEKHCAVRDMVSWVCSSVLNHSWVSRAAAARH
jgi:hypothetical protein